MAIRRRYRLHRCVIPVLLLAAVGADAQSLSRSTWGILGGIGRGIESPAVPIYSDPECGEFTGGNGGSWGGAFRGTAPEFFGKDVGLSLSLGARFIFSELTASPAQAQRIVSRGEIIDVDREFRLNVGYGMMFLDALGEYAPLDDLSIGLGPSFGYRFAGSFEQTDNILGPGSTSFDDGQRTRPMAEGSGREIQPLSLGAAATVAWRFRAGGGRWLLPHLTGRAEFLSPLAGASNWSSLSVGAGIGMIFGETPEISPALPPADPPPAPLLTASIDLYGLDDAGSRLAVTKIRAFEVLTRTRTPLLPAVFFEHGSDTIPERYMKRVEETDSTRGEILTTNRRILDIVGARLAERPASTLQLIGSVSGEESDNTAGLRANTIRSYLATTWGIDPERLPVRNSGGTRSREETEDGRAENRKVEFLSDDPAILAPVVNVRVVRNFTPPVLQVDPSYESQAGLRRWTIAISQDNHIVARYTSDEAEGGAPAGFNWRIRQHGTDSSLSPVVAELVVEDSTGRMVSARSHLPLVLEHRLDVVNPGSGSPHDRERSTFTLIGFDYGSAGLRPEHERELEEIAATADSATRITITGYTDRIGDEKLNAGLSHQRAEETARRLRAALDRTGAVGARITLAGGGVDRDQFDNDLPEGRMLSRGVQIVVEKIIP